MSSTSSGVLSSTTDSLTTTTVAASAFPIPDFWLGLILAVGSSFFIGSSFILQKLGLKSAGEKDGATSASMYTFNSFLGVFGVRLLSVLRDHSFFHPRHYGQWPPTSKDFPSQILSILFIFLFLILEKEPVFSHLKVWFPRCPNNHGLIVYRLLYSKVPLLQPIALKTWVPFY